MKILMQDGRMFQGTPLQIVRAMQDIAFGAADFTLPQSIDWVVANAGRLESVTLNVTGESDVERAASLVDQMVRIGLARRA